MNLSDLVILASVFNVILCRSTSVRPVTYKVYHKFEGVDYDQMPPELYEKNNDCYTLFVTCIRNRPIISPVCGWSIKTYYFDDYYSECEIELKNCLHRVKNNLGIYGTDRKKDIVYYNGEGYDCKYYVRMGGNMMDAYFGSPSSRRLYDYDKIRNLPYKFRQ